MWKSDVPSTPHVNFWTIYSRTKKQLSRSIPLRDDAVGVVALATLLVDPCQAKVGELELTSTIDKDVGSLDVAVDDALVVKVCKPREHLSTKRL